MKTTMVVSAWLMGLVGGPHCLVMCGAACAGISRAAGARGGRALWVFQLSRALGYGLMGALAAGSVQGLAWFGANTGVTRPIWSVWHIAALMLGVALAIRARQPAWIDGWAQQVWRAAKPVIQRLGGRAPVILGVGWALMPCGLLYSALLVASLSANAWTGAMTMVAFAAGTSVALTLGPGLALLIRGGHSGGWAVRLAGFSLAGTSGWALWEGLTAPTGLWCG